MEALTATYDNIVGDVLLSAGMVAYMGAFILDYRQVSKVLCRSAMLSQRIDLEHPRTGSLCLHLLFIFFRNVS